MNDTLAVVSVDLTVILRVLLAFGWGWAWAAYLQFTRHGQFMAQKRTWLTVVVGIGVDLLLAYPAGWFTVVLVVAASSIGIIVRSLVNEHNQESADINWQGYKVKHGLEDAAAIVGDVIKQLQTILDKNGLPAADVAAISRVLGRAHKLKETIIAARRGETLSK